MDCLAELEAGFIQANNDPKFWEEFRSYYPYMGRPGQLHLAERLTEHCRGANIWLKREDLNHTGSHKINNAIGQVLIARRLGKNEIIAETGAGQHGVATATVCAKFGMKCTVYMGAVSFAFHRSYLESGANPFEGGCEASSFKRFQNETFGSSGYIRGRW